MGFTKNVSNIIYLFQHAYVVNLYLLYSRNFMKNIQKEQRFNIPYSYYPFYI